MARHEGGRAVLLYRKRLRVSDVRQADKTDPVQILDNGIGKFPAILEALGIGHQFLAAEDKRLEGVVSSRLVIARVDIDSRTRTAQLPPIRDFARKHSRELLFGE